MGVCFAPKDFWSNAVKDCLFCRITRGEIPAQIIYQDESALAFKDINPQAPVHVLVIPKTHIDSVSAVGPAHEAEVGHLFTVAGKLAAELCIAESGYRSIFNTGPDAGQSVQHLHLHLVGGKPMGWPPFPR